jgi:hypothetical protein
VRAGLLSRAQTLAAEHRIYWLAASLHGAVAHHHKTVALNDGNGDGGDGNGGVGGAGGVENVNPEGQTAVARVGNVNQPVWAKTCWKHSLRLAGHQDNWNSQIPNSNSQGTGTGVSGNGGPEPGNFSGTLSGTGPGTGYGTGKDDSLAGVLEMSIYAALSNHTQVLIGSPLVCAWSDRLWVYIKASHERDLNRVVHRYRTAKAQTSAYFPGCDSTVIDTGRCHVT